ncbi:hypothetical protein [Undibacterium flavidum]|uniref:Fimbrial assembly protein PilN n=1 Tax=Undibacterium flavidum TaxID=2762297 RepID=A0ABR6YEA2_9BURK|nr:hypothetical protein [Undibacterium flavidum]MBC3874895.1 hypothetical protein [Undibacterium flavidum]
MKQRAQQAMLIDFTPNSAIHVIRKIDVMTWLFLVGSLFVCGLLIVKLVHMQKLLNSNAAKIQVLEQKQKATSNQKVLPPVAVMSTDEQKTLSTIITELNTPWTDFFDALETGTSGIHVLSIDPNTQKNLIRIQAESKTTEQMLDYLGSLNKSTLFKNPVLSKYEVNELDPNKPTRFSFEVTWVGTSK